MIYVYILLITIIVLDTYIMVGLHKRDKKDNDIVDTLDKFREEYVNYTISQSDLVGLSDDELIRKKLEIEFNGGVEIPYEYNRDK